MLPKPPEPHLPAQRQPGSRPTSGRNGASGELSTGRKASNARRDECSSRRPDPLSESRRSLYTALQTDKVGRLADIAAGRHTLGLRNATP